MKELKNVESIVEKILIEREDSRSSDDILYMYVCQHINPKVSKQRMAKFWSTRSKNSLPSYASVTRSRRKVFNNKPELRPAKVTEKRKEKEKEYIDYALNG